MDERQAAGVLAQCKWLRDQIKIQEDAAKAVLARHKLGGERVAAIMPDGTPLGTVTIAQGARTMQIDNEEGFLSWVQQRYPTEVIRSVRPAFIKQCGDRVKADGVLTDANGEVCPHVSLVTGDPKPTTNLSKDAALLLQQMIERRYLPDMLEYPAIEQGEIVAEIVEVRQNASVEEEPDLGEPEPDLEDMGPPHWRESSTFENSDVVRQRRGTGN
jgi:hypothetical protein